MNIIDTLRHAPLVSQICACFLVAFLVLFLGHFGLLCHRRRVALSKLIQGLRNLGADADPAPLFAQAGDLDHVWKEFGETLLDETEFNSITGQYEIKAKRASMPSEQFFSQQVVVDSYVWTEFYKHLPGILTGIGIIGTFFGVLHGLQAFNISEDAAAVRSGLGTLLGSVSEAFLVSAFAIFFAMLITTAEKFLLARLYKQAETLTTEIDKRYAAGAGEAMLQELVHSTNRYVTNSETLKDALVSDLKGILTSLSESQIAAQEKIVEALRTNQQSTSSLGKEIGEHITAGLKEAIAEPMQAVQRAVENATGDRTSAVNTLLTETVQALKQSLKDLFGEQITGINEMQQKTIETLQAAVARMEQMTRSVETAGTDATTKMAEKLEEAIKGMDARQEVLGLKLSQVVEKMQECVGTTQEETNRQLQAAITGVSTTLKELVGTLSEKVATTQDVTSEKLERALTEVSSTVQMLVSTLSQSVASTNEATNEKLATAVAEVSSNVQSLVATLAQTVSSSTETTNEKLASAVADVSTNVQNLVNGLSQSVVQAQAQSNASLEGAVSSVGARVNSYVSEMSLQAAKAEAERVEREKELIARAEANGASMKAALESVTSQMRDLVSGTRSAVDTMRESVNSMRTITSDTVTRMNSGADTMYVAASEFTKAGNSVSGVLQQASSATDKLAEAAGSVGGAAQIMQRVVEDYRTTRELLDQTLAEAGRIVKDAKDHASLTGDTLRAIQQATASLHTAQIEVDKFMQGVAEVLGESTSEFQTRLADTMTMANRDLVNTTTKVTGLLGRMITQLATATTPVVIAEGA